MAGISLATVKDIERGTGNPSMRTVTKILPGFWYERANDLLCGDQKGGLSDVWICFAVQGGFILIFLILTIIRSSRHPKAKVKKNNNPGKAICL